ncbi:MAG: Outer membrane protein P6 precursor [Syntrophorhabdus sp. PtaB.Bin047]|jgi:peptidoglycan-associated lipoprotein|nr:MAG: Outer membrane protein P6 precursor [Syntrophorhabdus sp. PtaB.Bin047]
MKIRSLSVILLVALISISLGGCGCFWQHMKGETPPPAAGPATTTPPEKKVDVPVAVSPLKDINFDFDKYAIRDADGAILKENLKWFQAKENAGKKVRIEGHCDERGTVEYNLVLGQKRADSAKNFLVNLGADSRLLETVSYGKEKPVDPGHNEAAWAKNRRAHFLALQ